MPAKTKAPKPGRIASATDLRKQRKQSLAGIRSALESLQQQHINHEDAFLLTVLPTRLKMGLHCLKAHMLFAIPDAAKRGSMKGKKSSSTVDELSPQGFEGWLATEIPWLKKPTAYRWMKAFKGLLLDETATEADVEKSLAALIARHAQDGLPAPSLKSLEAAAIDLITTDPGNGGGGSTTEQLSFDFLKGELSKYRQFTDTLLNLKSDLEKNPDFLRTAMARAYHVLHELTGKHWQPSDNPDELADIDPDTITV